MKMVPIGNADHAIPLVTNAHVHQVLVAQIVLEIFTYMKMNVLHLAQVVITQMLEPILVMLATPIV